MPSKSQATVAPRELGKGIYMTPDKEVAAYYAGINGSIIHTNIDVKNVAVVNNYQQDMIPETLEKVLDIGLSATFEVEAVVNELFKRNGYDAIYSREALGTGALANPKLIDKLSILNDSKKLSATKREYLYDFVLNETINSTICVEVEDIEKYNILACSLRAMKLACENIIQNISKNDILVLVDGNKLIRDFNFPQQYIIKGDSKSASIAAASILAKVTRDRYMQKLDEEFPQYNWKQNAGYLTKQHLEAIDKYGVTKHHRKSFLKKHFEKQLTLF